MLLLVGSDAAAARTASAARASGTSLGRDLDSRRQAKQQRVVRGDYPRPKHPLAWNVMRRASPQDTEVV
jgi:hypothetical protein